MRRQAVPLSVAGSGSPPQNVIPPPQLGVPGPQPLQPVPLDRGQLLGPLATVGLVLTHPVLEGFRMHA
jgi:hypothetical protein